HQVSVFDALSEKADKSGNATLSIERYKDELRFYAEALAQGHEWCPASGKEQRRAALARVFTSIDNFTKQYYGDVKSLGNGGHQSDWGGYYAALGEALYIVEDLIADEDVHGTERFRAFLREPFDTGTRDGENSLPSTGWDGGRLTRFGAWERVLKANFDFARSRLSYIYNQVLYTYEGAWKAHEGLRVIGSEFYEGKERSHAIAREALGARPFLGEEILTGPEGEKLNLYHSLFFHDRTAVYTDDCLRVVMRGLARSKPGPDQGVARRLPYGRHYTGITAAGQTRENHYVGNYGEAGNYLPCWFFRTLGHDGDEELNDDILRLALRNLHARARTRYQGTDPDGHRIMYMEQVVDGRNTAYPGKVAYATATDQGPYAFSFAALAHHMSRRPERFRGKEWEPYRRYAREAVGFLQQQLADNQFFPYFDSHMLPKHVVDLRLPETWAYVAKTPAGTVLPHTDLDRYTDAELRRLGVDRRKQPTRFAWADIDNLYVAVRDGDTHLFASLVERNNGLMGNGRLHAQYGTHDQLVQLPTRSVFTSREYTLRAPSTENSILFDRFSDPGDRPLAMTGEPIPVAFQPGVGRPRRDNNRYDTPYAGYPELLTARYGPYFFAVNTTRRAHGNERPLTAVLPEGTGDGPLLDLVSRRRVRPRGGRVVLAPGTALVLALGTARVGAEPPAPVDLVLATPGSGAVGLSWRAAAGAASYTVSRSVRRGGRYAVVEEGVTGTSYTDESVRDGGRFFYRVTPVGTSGKGRASAPAEARAHPATGNGWRGRPVGAARGTARTRGTAVSVRGASGAGFGGGDDSVLHDRDRPDAFVLASTLVRGSVAVSARLGSPRAALAGVTLRASAHAVSRYVHLGTDGAGGLVLRTRSMDSRPDVGKGTVGHDAGNGITRSPLARTEEFAGFPAADYPYVRLVRAADSHRVTALVSRDGELWERVTADTVPMPEVVHAGVAATADTDFTRVTVETLPEDAALPTVARDGDGVRVHWNKPRHAVSFTLYGRRGDGGWRRLTGDAYRLDHRHDAALGSTRYRVVARHADGSTTSSPAPSSPAPSSPAPSSAGGTE
ncbi:fibronectin type III domain-containing protein, partial [Streptomyces boncukensis]